MKFLSKLLLALMLPVAAMAAGPANDAGVAATSGTYSPAAFSVSTVMGPTTQLGRIFRDGVPSVCVPQKAYPGNFNAATTMNYSAFTLYNNGPTQCVTVNFDPDTVANACTTNAHISAYLDSYNPANQAANYLGDVGSSTVGSFSFQAPTGARIILVVTNTASAQAGCGFAFSTNQLDAEIAAPPGPIPTLGNWSLVLLSFGLLGAAWFARRRFLR